MSGLFRRRARPEGVRIFFATDVHGSDRCFKKFIGAAKFYNARYLILGGDITGKTLVPVERTTRGWTARFGDHTYIDMTDSERRDLEQSIRDNGQYPIEGERDVLMQLHDETHREIAFRAAAVDGIRRWVAIAEERLAGTDVRCFITPGNDDYWEIDEPLQASSTVEFVEGRCVRLNDDHEMITTGYSNITPWQSPREISEPEFSKLLEGMFTEVADPENLICVFHPPPYDTDLDQAPAIDSEFRMQMSGGAPKMIPVGSTAVRAFIEEHQPLLALHGHVHESKAAQRIGRTLCLNPGSEYPEGVLSGALVTVGAREVTAHQFTLG